MSSTKSILINSIILLFTISCGRRTNVFANYTCETPPEWFPVYPNETITQSELTSTTTENTVWWVEEKISRKNHEDHGKYQIWPDGIVYYTITSQLNMNESEIFVKAIREFESKTCIRFKERKEDKNYVNITINENIECGKAKVCMQPENQFAHFTRKCWNKATIVHELGHTVCLSHEQYRSDNDNFVSFESCTAEERKNAKPKNGQGEYSHKGIYDYASQMHYQCSCKGMGGIPKIENWKYCGEEIDNGLSVMDAEYINELYSCEGCYRHRWIGIKDISENDLVDMYNFGHYDHSGNPVYPCRALYKGEVAVGIYTEGIDGCRIPSRFDNRSVVVTDWAEVLTIPGGLSSCSGDSDIFHYQLVNVLSIENSWELIREAVPAGNGWNLNETWFGKGYIAFGSLTWNMFEFEDGIFEDAEYKPAMDQIGTMWDWGDGRKLEAVFSTHKGNIVNARNFKVLICKRSKDSYLSAEEKIGREVDEFEGSGCDTGCIKTFDGTCKCSTFDDYY